MLAQYSAGLLWITRGRTSNESTVPQFSMFHGMARSIRAEQEGFPCVTIDFDSETILHAEKAVDLLVDVYIKAFTST